MRVRFAGRTPEKLIKGTRLHAHPCWEILYYLSGTGTLTVGGRSIDFEPGDVVCQPPDIPHRESSKGGFQNIFLEVPDFAAHSGGDMLVYKKTDPFIKLVFEQIYTEFHLRSENSANIISSLFNVIYEYMLSWDAGAGDKWFVNRVKLIIISNLGNSNFDLNKEMGKIPLSKDYLRKLFKAETGTTPSQYLAAKRIDYAKSLLDKRAQTSAKIYEIANLSGFNDPFYFSRVFKKMTGESPQSYLSSEKERSEPPFD